MVPIVFLVLNIGGAGSYPRKSQRVDNDPVVLSPPSNFRPHVPPGFNVSVFAKDFSNPRWLAFSPNGDVFVADSGTGQVIVLDRVTARGTAESRWAFANHLSLPFGIAFWGEYVYVAETDRIVRFRYDSGSSRRLGDAEHILDLPGRGYHQHWTRSIAFSFDGRELFVSVGSQRNFDIESDPHRGAILVADPDDKNARIFASGLRNAVGIAFNPQTGTLLATVNERDDLGDDVSKDFLTHVQESGFYGWQYALATDTPITAFSTAGSCREDD